MTTRPPTSVLDRCLSGAFGALTGGCYGLVLAWIVSFFGSSFPFRLVTISTVVFSVIGLAWGRIVEDAFVALAHFIWGLLRPGWGVFDVSESEDSSGLLSACVLLGTGTGVVMLVWRCL